MYSPNFKMSGLVLLVIVFADIDEVTTNHELAKSTSLKRKKVFVTQ